MKRWWALSLAAALAWSATAAAQPVPRPFPRPGEPPPAPQAPPTPAPAPAPSAAADDEPTEALLGVPVYPAAQFIASYDAGQGQRYYLFGTTNSFNEIVAYYRTVLKQKGQLVFDAPATHMFEVGRFREESMAFPPGVTVKDYTWNNSPGYLNPRPGKGPARFHTIIQIVPVPPADRR